MKQRCPFEGLNKVCTHRNGKQVRKRFCGYKKRENCPFYLKWHELNVKASHNGLKAEFDVSEK
jgi:hypothetical protein